MIIAALVGIFLCWLLAAIAVRRTGEGINRTALVANYGMYLFFALLFSLGFAFQQAVDAYIGGHPDDYLSDLQHLPTPLFYSMLGVFALMAILPAAAGALASFGARSFLSALVRSSLAALLALILIFSVSFWSEPYSGSVGLSFLLALIGCLAAAYLAQALRAEMLLSSGIRALAVERLGRLLVIMTTVAFLLAMILPSLVYYAAVFPMQRPVDLRFSEWDYIMVTASTPEPVYLNGRRDQGYQPALPFAQAILEEKTATSPQQPQAPPAYSKFLLRFERMMNPTSHATIGSIQFVNGDGSPKPAPGRLLLLRFSGCTAADIAKLRPQLAAGRVGETINFPGTAELSFHATAASIFHPGKSAPDIFVMLPAWQDDWIHLRRDGDSVGVGAQSPAPRPARATLSSRTALDLVVSTDADLSADRVRVRDTQGRRVAAKRGLIHECSNPRVTWSNEAMIPWERITTDNKVLLAGYLISFGSEPRARGASTLEEYSMSIANPSDPTTVNEYLVLSATKGQSTGALAASRATVAQVSADQEALITGRFGGKTYSKQPMRSATVAGRDLQFTDVKSESGHPCAQGRRFLGRYRRRGVILFSSRPARKRRSHGFGARILLRIDYPLRTDLEADPQVPASDRTLGATARPLGKCSRNCSSSRGRAFRG